MALAGSARRVRKLKSPRVKDPRDLSDKTWQKEARQKIIHFLVEHRYPHEVSPKKMSGLTQKEFFTMMSFIIRLVEPAATRELSNNSESMEYLIKYMKGIKYHAMPNKSALQAVSSPVYWPSILGLLAWLVTYATYVIGRTAALQSQDQVRTKHDSQRQRLTASDYNM